ncbi:hypothetical protein [Paraburkholderia kururiensis]|nr:hypothetical protein [Paraburkholderia kururiensis]
MRRIVIVLTFAGLTQLQACASTVGNLALGAGIGAVAAVSAMVCAIGCH